MATPLVRDARGFESQLATNHLGHFQLTARLWPALRSAKGARVVVAVVARPRLRGVDFDDPNFERRPYDKWKAYGQSKTANALFALALDARGEAHGVRAFSVHPGAVHTELARSVPDEELARSSRSATHRGDELQDAGAGRRDQRVVRDERAARRHGRRLLRGRRHRRSRDAPTSQGAHGVRPWAMDPRARRAAVDARAKSGPAWGSRRLRVEGLRPPQASDFDERASRRRLGR